jgi:nucleoid-associated protein YgaU
LAKAIRTRPPSSRPRSRRTTRVKDLGVKFTDGKVELTGSGPVEALQKAILIAGNAMGVSEVKIAGAAASSVEDGTQYYVIKSGDTLSAIAKQFYGDVNQYPKIFDANREVIKDANLIFPGQKIRIPKA